MELIEPHLTGQPGQHGDIAKDNRKFINAVVWILKTESPWRDSPHNYEKWGTVHQRFVRWRRKGIWKKLFETLMGCSKVIKNLNDLMIDASYVKDQQHSSGVRGKNQAISKIEGSEIPKSHLVINKYAMQTNFIVANGLHTPIAKKTLV